MTPTMAIPLEFWVAKFESSLMFFHLFLLQDSDVDVAGFVRIRIGVHNRVAGFLRTRIGVVFI